MTRCERNWPIRLGHVHPILIGPRRLRWQPFAGFLASRAVVVNQLSIGTICFRYGNFSFGILVRKLFIESLEKRAEVTKMKFIAILVAIFACLLYYAMRRRPGPTFVAGFKEQNKDNSSGPWSFKRGPIAVYAIQGRRPYMEDRFSVVESGDFLGFAVYDGHGGAFFADYAEQHLLPSILRTISNTKAGHLNFTEILINELLALDQSAMRIGGKKRALCGSTALIGVVYHKTLYVANTGDCRAVAKLIGTDDAMQITIDHKPNEKAELARIEAAGGFVSFRGVWRVGGSLAVSRAIGDSYLKRKGWLIAAPDVYIIDVERVQVDYVILASDGLWDVFSSQEAIDFVAHVKDEQLWGAKQLVEKAFQKGSTDNICVLIRKFPR